MTSAWADDEIDALKARVEANTRQMLAACRHCGEPIMHGKVWAHVIGPGSMLIRCDPAKSGKPYGLNAEPEDAS